MHEAGTSNCFFIQDIRRRSVYSIGLIASVAVFLTVDVPVAQQSLAPLPTPQVKPVDTADAPNTTP